MLNKQQIQNFIDHNYVVLEDCFSAETAREWVENACRQTGIDLKDAVTWPQPHCFLGQHMTERKELPLNQFSSKLWVAIRQLVGGEERIQPPLTVNDAFVVNFSLGSDQPWTEPIEREGGWHVDGDFNQFIDSPEAGLFILMLFTDVELHGGGTYIAPDSIPHILRHFLDHPQGLSAYQLRTSHNVARQCNVGIPAMGKAGTVYLIYPQMLHTTSQNLLRKPRFIRNGQVRLKAPMRFDRCRRENLSPVERCALRNLGLERLEFFPPSEDLRMATDHDDGQLLPWKYGEKPSYKNV